MYNACNSTYKMICTRKKAKNKKGHTLHAVNWKQFSIRHTQWAPILELSKLYTLHVRQRSQLFVEQSELLFLSLLHGVILIFWPLKHTHQKNYIPAMKLWPGF